MEGEKLSAVRIAVREAPFRQFLGRREPSIVEFPPWGDGKSLVVEQNEFHFDHAFPSTVGQDEMYQTLILPLVEKFLQGYQCTALAYGQTGTGKSYSMGMASPDKKPEHLGVLPRCLGDILDHVSAKQENQEDTTQVYASFIEIYNEKAYDLLGSQPHVPTVASRCQSCTCLPLSSQKDLQTLLQLGTRNRRVRPTNLNASSSRSHAVVTIHARNSTFHSRMNVVDLAGSEGVRRTGNEGVARQEGVNINLGLLSINKVVMSMAAGHSVIPYRDSVLTTVLQESLTAQSFLTFLACISPHRCDLSETLSTLRFGTSAKKLRLAPMQVARQKQSLAARTPHTFRQVLSSSTAIKRPGANQNSHSVSNMHIESAKPLANILQRTRSELGMTPKAKKRARELLQLEDTTLEPSTIVMSDTLVGFNGEINGDQQLMPPPEMEYRQASSQDFTPVCNSKQDEPEKSSTIHQSVISPTVRCQLFNTSISSISLGASRIQQDISGIQPIEEILEQRPQPPCPLRRSVRLASTLRQETSDAIPNITNLRRSRRLAEIREHVASVVVNTKSEPTVIAVNPRAVVRPQQNTRQRETAHSRKLNPSADEWLANHHKYFLDLLNSGNLKELQKMPGIGPKTAFSLTLHRSHLGCFQDLDQVKGLPIWRGTSWDRFSQANCLHI